jgi:probable rRNA maturation factor
MNIFFNYDESKFRIREPGKVKKTIEKILIDNNRKLGEINFVFTSDEKILAINREFLKHNYFTDIITFNYSIDDIVSGELYISVPTVRENAEIFGNAIKDEINRVVFHGILHLCGYDDQSEDDRMEMRSMEEKYLVFLSL